MDFTIWDELDSFSLLEAAYLWCEKEPLPPQGEREQRPSNVDAVLGWLTTAAKAREFSLVPGTFVIVTRSPDYFERGAGSLPDKILYVDDRTRVQRDHLQAWARTKQLRRLFLFPEDRALAHPDPPYSTPLLEAQRAAIQEFWLDYDPTKPPKKETIVEWLLEHFKEIEITKNQAEAIDLIIRPDDRRKGGRVKR